MAVKNLDERFAGILCAWELSNRLSDKICRTDDLKSCRDWTFELSDINHYNWCFWLVGLALALNIPEVEWQRLLALIDAEGQDELLDRVIASRQKDRSIGVGIIHQKPYARLLRAVKGSKEDRPKLLREFLDNWYLELARKGKGKDELWWYTYGDPIKSPLEKGSYFGRWCVEAAIAAKVFVIDDKYCLGHDYYPGDLLRPNGPSTHRDRAPVAQGFLSKIWRKLN